MPHSETIREHQIPRAPRSRPIPADRSDDPPNRPKRPRSIGRSIARPRNQLSHALPTLADLLGSLVIGTASDAVARGDAPFTAARAHPPPLAALLSRDATFDRSLPAVCPVLSFSSSSSYITLFCLSRSFPRCDYISTISRMLITRRELPCRSSAELRRV